MSAYTICKVHDDEIMRNVCKHCTMKPLVDLLVFNHLGKLNFQVPYYSCVIKFPPLFTDLQDRWLSSYPRGIMPF